MTASSAIGYLREIRSRILHCLLFFLLAFGLAFYHADTLLQIITKPFEVEFIYTELAEAFTSRVKIAIFAAVYLSIPIVAWHAYRFAAPALYKRERASLKLIIVLVVSLFLGGLMFFYQCLLPWAWKFFIGFQREGLQLVPKISEFTSFLITCSTALGIAFQFPIVLIVLMHFGVFQHQQLAGCRRLVIVLIFIIAAVITPPDILSQVAVAIPMMAMYELTIIAGKYARGDQEPS